MQKNHFISEEPRIEKTGPEYDYPEYDPERVADLIDDGVRFSAKLDLKAIDGGDEAQNRIIEGYASTKDIDRVGEIIQPTAFEASLELLKEGRIKVLVDHMPPSVGKIIGGRINNKGLWIKARIFKGIRDADEAWSRILQGGFDAFSVGFRSVSDELRRVSGAMRRVITEGDLFEVSLATLPANVSAQFSVTKSLMYGSDMFEADRTRGLWVPVRFEKESLNTKEKDADYSETRDYIREMVRKIDAEAPDLELRETARLIKEKTKNL